MTQPLFETGEHGILAAGLDIDDPGRRQASVGQRRGKQILPGDAPQDRPPAPRGDAGREQRGHRAMHRPVAAAGDLVQGAAGETASR